MKNMQVVKISLYLTVLTLANFIVLWFGQIGLLFTALLLIPFDFVMRCMFHEQWKGIELIIKLGILVCLSSLITYLINKDLQNIAFASVAGFISSQIAAGIFYQLFINKSYFIKVNGSDVVGIVFDSLMFQIIAFGTITLYLSITQIILKVLGGLFWYWVIFKKLKFQQK